MLTENPAEMSTDDIVRLLDIINNEFAAILISKEQLEGELKKRAIGEERTIRTGLYTFVYVPAGTRTVTDTQAYTAAIKAAGIDKKAYESQEERAAHVQMRKVSQL